MHNLCSTMDPTYKMYFLLSISGDIFINIGLDLLVKCHLKDLLTANTWLQEFTYHEFHSITLSEALNPLDLNPHINDLVSDKSIIESRKHWTYELDIAAYREK